jgi:hypothetical protein
MKEIERRSSVRKPIRMACEVRFPSGVAIRGITRNISLNGVEIEASSVSGGADRAPSPGEAGLLTLKFKHAGSPDSILVQCQVVHILANGMGLSAQFSQLNRREQELLGRMVASGRAQVDELVAA